jgi:4-amino-4-deoxy-L-arabinose transferase-like glycosyltransferase
MTEKLEKALGNRWIQYVLLAIITLVAFALRFYKLGEWSFWYDESYTLRDVRRLFELGLLDQQISRSLIYLVVNTLGTSEFTARLAPALIGVLSIPILFFPIRQMLGPGVALLASLFLAINPWHLYWSQNARFYTALLLFYTLALLVFYFGIEKDKPWYMVLTLVLLGLAVQERLFAVFLVPVVAAYLLILRFLPFEKPAGLRWRNILILFIPSLLIGLLYSLEFIQDPQKWLRGFTWVNNNPFWILSGVIFYVGLPFMCMGAVAAIFMLVNKNRAALLLALAAVFPLAALMALSLFQYTANRYAFVSLTSWLILAALGVWLLFTQSKGLGWVLAVGALLILTLEPISEAYLYYRYQNGNRDNWKAAFTLINRLKEPGDQVVVTNTQLGDFYTGEPTQNYIRFDTENLPDDGSRIWFVEDNNLGEKIVDKLRWVETNSEMIANFDVHVRARNFKMRVYLLDPETQ